MLRWFVGLAIFAAFAYLVEIRVGWGAIFDAWTVMPPGLLAVAAVLLMASYALRAVRIYDYFRDDLAGRFAPTMRLVLFHNLLNNLMPMRSGEVAFPVLMQRYFAVPLGRSVPALVWFRILDAHFLAVVGGIAFFWGRAPWWLVTAGTLLAGCVPLVLHEGRRRIEARFADGTGRFARTLTRIVRGIPSGTGAFMRTWWWTVANWSVKLSVFAWLLGIFARTGFVTALLGSLLGEFTSVLPVHGFAGTGTYEGGIVAALVPLGIGADVAVTAAVNLHLFLLGGTILGAAIGALILPRPAGKPSEPGGPALTGTSGSSNRMDTP